LDYYPLLKPQSEHPDIENIKIILKLTKSKFLLGEPITGQIEIVNNNNFDITLTYPPIQIVEHFTIYSKGYPDSYFGLPDELLHPIEVKAKDITIIEFKIDRYFKLPMPSKNINFTYLELGNYSIFIVLYYDGIPGSNIIKSNTVDFEVVSKASSTDNDKIPGKANPFGLTYRFFVGYIVTLTLIIILIPVIFIAGTEVGKYSFFSAMTPFYTKERRKKTKESGYIRGLLLGYVDGNPGESYSVIKRALGLNNGTLSYYLKVLEREHEVVSERDGFLKRFYPADGRYSKDVFELTDIQQTIHWVIKENPGISQKEIQSKLGISQQRLNYHIRLMADARLIRFEREGKISKCFVIEEYKAHEKI
jgi:predicted transcriptional regulator